jgi:hypothetical protein
MAADARLDPFYAQCFKEGTLVDVLPGPRPSSPEAAIPKK